VIVNKFDSTQTLAAAFDSWIAEQIEKLSVDALSSEVLTCTACAETSGEYVIEYQGETFRYPPEKTYAFLKFVTEHLQE
jgi:hypothetical protein